MVIELFSPESFSEGVGQVFLSIDLSKIDVTSIFDLSYKVIAMQHIWFFGGATIH